MLNFISSSSSSEVFSYSYSFSLTYSSVSSFCLTFVYSYGWWLWMASQRQGGCRLRCPGRNAGGWVGLCCGGMLLWDICSWCGLRVWGSLRWVSYPVPNYAISVAGDVNKTMALISTCNPKESYSSPHHHLQVL